MVRQHLDWQGTAQPVVGSSCPVRCNDLSHHQNQHLVFLTLCQLDVTYNWWLLLPMFLSSSNSWMKLECPLQMTGLGRVYGSSGLPNSQDSLLGSFWCGPMERISPVWIGIREFAGVAWSILVDYIHLRDSTPDFLSGFTPSAFSSPKPTGSGVFCQGYSLAFPLLRYPQGSGAIYP